MINFLFDKNRIQPGHRYLEMILIPLESPGEESS